MKQLATYCCQPLIFSSLQVSLLAPCMHDVSLTPRISLFCPTQIQSKCLILENIALLLKIFPLRSFSKFVLTAAVMSISYLQRDNEALLMESLLTGLASASSSDGLTEPAKKCLSNIVKKLFVEMSGNDNTSSSVTLSVSLLEKLSLCLSHCDPEDVSQWCNVTSNSPVSLITYFMHM